MLVEPQKPETPRPTSEEELTTRGLLPDEEKRKQELLEKKAKKEKHHERLSKAEDKELEALLTIEKLEHERMAAIHKLSETADTYGRKEITRIKREITDQVKELHADEQTVTAGIFKIYKKGMGELDKETKAAMQRIQEQHNTMLKQLTDKRDADVRDVRDGYRKQYDEREAQMSADTNQVSDLVAAFIADIQELELEQLKELATAGITQVGGQGKDKDYLVVPGTEK